MDEKQRLLQKFAKKQCSQQELRLLLKYLEQDSSSDYEQVMDEVWQEVHALPPLEPRLSNAMYEEVQARIQSNKSSSLTRTRQIRPFKFQRAMARTAAALAGVILSGWLIYSLSMGREEMYETAFGTMTTVQLPDHSTVTLNGNSRIRFSETWDESEIREVWLQGEAFFSVVHTPDHKKFVVHTNNMEIEVLGTEFNVNNRRGETKVTLSSGAVKLNGKGKANKIKNVLMHPGEQASLDHQQQFHLEKVDTRKFTTWKDNVMIFDHTAVKEVAVMIEETYGLEVILRGDSIEELELTGSLPANDIHALLGMLKATLDLDVSWKGDRVIISER
jgi:transmembrane sensor